MSPLAKFAVIAGLALPTAALMLSHAAPPVDESVSAAQSGVAMGEGEVRKIGKDAGKLTIRHGALKNFDMPPMSMVFGVKEPAMLSSLRWSARSALSPTR